METYDLLSQGIPQLSRMRSTCKPLEHHKATCDEDRSKQSCIAYNGLDVFAHLRQRCLRRQRSNLELGKSSAAVRIAQSAHPDIGFDRLQLKLDILLRTTQPLQRTERFLITASQHQEARRLRYVDHSQEQHHRCDGHQHCQLPPIQIGTQRKGNHNAQMAGHLLDGTEKSSDVGRRDFTNVHL